MNAAIRWWEKLCFVLPVTLLWSIPAFSGNDISITLDPMVGGLVSPVFVSHAGDGTGRLFIVEQAGRILIFQNGNLEKTPFLDVRDRVTSGGELGLLSVAFHPDFRNNGRFFVNYTDRRPNLKSFISEYHVSSGNPNLALPDEKVILTFDQPFANHKGGQLRFGPDGYLYNGTGDGGSGGDPLGNGQNTSTLLGKILRIDVDGGTPYAIPLGNPFSGGGGLLEIWAYGLRNPWRFSFDRLTGRLFAGDVGQNSYEEIDLISRGGNFGWNIMEGNHCYSPQTGCDSTGLILPIDEYNHALGNAVIGGYVYRGEQYPALKGVYLFGDFGSSRIWALTETDQGTWTRTQLLTAGFDISSFGEDESGELYVVNYGGSLHRLRLLSPVLPHQPAILVPSAVRTDRFFSSLSVVNIDSAANHLLIRAFGLDGTVTGSQEIELPPGGVYHSTGITIMPPNSFGPLIVESLNDRKLVVVSEARTNSGAADNGAFFPGLLVREASQERIIPDVADSGDLGMAGTSRTNLGINNPNASLADVQVDLVDRSGSILGSERFSIAAFGMIQINGIVRSIVGAHGATGISGHLRLTSNAPIHAWASKIDNGTNDPSLEVAIGDLPQETNVRLLIPSVSDTERFKSSLTLVNRDHMTNRVLLTARSSDSQILGRQNITLPPLGPTKVPTFLRQWKQLRDHTVP
jgi:glucose/arabinose dehydrogenase